MDILIACEFSGAVRDAFILRGHNAISCDLHRDTERPGPHIIGDVVDLIHRHRWDMMIAFPPCQYLTSAGARWWKLKRWQTEQKKALAFVHALMDAPIHKIAIENPRGRIGTAIRKADQEIQPWMFGHRECKRTGLWLKNLPLLTPTNIIDEDDRCEWVLQHTPSRERAANRSRTFTGIALAMAEPMGMTNEQTG